MSYSRWGSRGSGKFYTYWLTTDSNKRDEQMFDICGFTTISYKDILEHGIDGVVEILKQRLIDMNKKAEDNEHKYMFLPESYTNSEWEELKIYIGEWVVDIKKEFDTPSQQYRDGKITLEDAFIEEI